MRIVHAARISAALLAGAVAVVAAGGCTSYYRVTDPSTDKVYYTTELKKRGSGTVTLRDGRTGSDVTLQNSQVEKISKEQFDSGRFSAPAPAKKASSTPPSPFAQ